jgi:hypothetical protein
MERLSHLFTLVTEGGLDSVHRNRINGGLWVILSLAENSLEIIRGQWIKTFC